VETPVNFMIYVHTYINTITIYTRDANLAI